jgi:L-histidine N-alpha-methyltransferase
MEGCGDDRFSWLGENERVPWVWARRFEFEQLYVDPGAGRFLDEVLLGLSSEPKSLPYYYLYDERGSRLFERITRMPEYYPTACEREILRERGAEIYEAANCPRQIVEFGSGSSEKTRFLLDVALQSGRDICYVPIDISADALKQAALSLIRDFEGLSVHALAAEYRQGLRALDPDGPPRMFLFMGSSMGNLSDREAISFLRAIRDCCRPVDTVLVGADLEKPTSIVEAAYNDPAGETAQFNLNILDRVNRELDGNFDLSAFRHEAPYFFERGYVEMRLVSIGFQVVEIGSTEREFEFEEGEHLWTERSRKYSIERLDRIFRRSRFESAERWFDRKDWVSVSLLEPA